jgi:hypothetical protein
MHFFQSGGAAAFGRWVNPTIPPAAALKTARKAPWGAAQDERSLALSESKVPTARHRDKIRPKRERPFLVRRRGYGLREEEVARGLAQEFQVGHRGCAFVSPWPWRCRQRRRAVSFSGHDHLMRCAPRPRDAAMGLWSPSRGGL